jgi:hypothetical protein
MRFADGDKTFFRGTAGAASMKAMVRLITVIRLEEMQTDCYGCTRTRLNRD